MLMGGNGSEENRNIKIPLMVGNEDNRAFGNILKTLYLDLDPGLFGYSASPNMYNFPKFFNFFFILFRFVLGHCPIPIRLDLGKVGKKPDPKGYAFDNF